MCRSCGKRHNSVVEDVITTSPRAVLPQDVGSLESITSSFSQGWHTGSATGSGRGTSSMLPPAGGCGGGGVRGSGLTMKEYDQHLSQLNKENFALKLRIYFLEEQQGQASQSAPQLYNTNLELKVENESLKRQLYEKQQLLTQASTAMSQMDEDYKEQLNSLLQDNELKIKHLQDDATQLSKALEQASARCEELEALQHCSSGGQPQITQLCDLAFPSQELWSSKGGPPPTESTQWMQGGNPWGDQDIMRELERKLSGGAASDGGSCTGGSVGGGGAAGSGGGVGGDATNPLNINTTNVTNNNITNTLPNTSNNLQQMQCQQQQTPPQYGTAEQQQYYQQQQQHGGASNGGATTVLVVPVPPNADQQLPMVPVTPAIAAQGGAADSTELIKRLEAELSMLQARLQALQSELSLKDQQTAGLQSQVESLLKELQERERDVVEREEKLETLSQELETRHRELQTRNDTITSLHSDLDRVEPEISVKVQEIVERDRIIEEKIEQIEQQNKILVEIQITLDEKQKQIAELEASLNDAKSRVQQLQADYDKGCDTINALTGEKESRDKDIQALKKELKKKDRRIKDLMAELKETLDGLAKAQWEVETGRVAREDTVKEMAEEENERLWADIEQKKKELHELRTELTRAVDEKNLGLSELSASQSALKAKDEMIEALSSEAQKKDEFIGQSVEALEAVKAELSDARSDLMNKKLELSSMKSSWRPAAELEQLTRELQESRALRESQVEALKTQLELCKNEINELRARLNSGPNDVAQQQRLSSEKGNAAPGGQQEKTSIGVTGPPMTPVHVSINTGVAGQQHTATTPDAVKTASVSEMSDGRPTTSSILEFQRQVEHIRRDLRDTKSALGSQINELGNKKDFKDIARRYRDEVLKLRKRLTDSNSACEMLRNRLEELAMFFEKLLEMDEQGLIDISKLSGFDRKHLHKSLNDTKQLSQTLSMSMLLDMDPEFLDELEGYDETQSIVPEEPSSLMENTTTNVSCLRDSMLEVTRLGEMMSGGDYQLVASKLCNEVDQRAQQLDDVLSQVARISEEMEQREASIISQAEIIKKLQQRLQEKEEAAPVSSVECQTLLAMAPRQSQVCSLADLSTPFLSSCSESLNKTAEEKLPTDASSKLLSPKATSLASTAITKPLLSKLKTGGYASASEIQHHAAPHMPASPSESEAWSEPDRNVSLARIGLETCTLAVSVDRCLSRSRQTRASAALSSESDTEECQAIPDESVNASLLSASNVFNSQLPVGTCASKPVLKRRSDASEVRRLATKLRALEHLNETLKAELNIYQSLSHQLSPTTDQQQSDSRSSHSFSEVPDHHQQPLAIEGPAGAPDYMSSSCSHSSNASLALKKLRRFGAESDTIALAAPLLQEIRSLRTKLEESISNNDQLRDQLEAAVLSCNKATDDPNHLTHLTAALLNAQETLQLTREKLAFAQRCEQVQADRCVLAEKRADEDSKQCETLKEQLQETRQHLTAAENAEKLWYKKAEELKKECEVAEMQLEEANKLHEESEAALQERLAEVRQACEESEARLKTQHDAIEEVYKSLHESSSQWSHVTHLHSALQASETQVLRVTRDRLALLGEKSKLQAQLLSVQAQTCLLQDSLCEEDCTNTRQHEEEPTQDSASNKRLTLHHQLARVQAAVKALQDQCNSLQTANANLTRHRDQLQEKLAGYKAVEKLSCKPDITLESVISDSNGKPGEPGTAGRVATNGGSVALVQLQRSHSMLQNDYSHLQKLYNQLHDAEQSLCKQLHATKSSLDRSEKSIVSLTQQYQERLQLTQMECVERLADAEQKIASAQQRAQQRVELSEQKLSEVQRTCEAKLEELKQKYIEECERRDGQLRMAQSMLQAEQLNTQSLREELNKLKNKSPHYSIDSAVWSEDKENLHRPPATQHTKTSSTSSTSGRSPMLASPMRSSNCALPPSPRTPQRMPSSRSPGDGAGFKSPRSPRHQYSPSSARRFSAAGSSAGLHYSDPNLGLPLYQTTDDEGRPLDSPDLGLGSSDNGASSLERVTGEGGGRTIPVQVTDRLSLPVDLNASARSAALTTSCSEPRHSSLMHTNSMLLEEIEHLQRQLTQKESYLASTLQQLESANARKQNVEKAIYRQLNKTHQVLKKANNNMQKHKSAGGAGGGAHHTDQPSQQRQDKA